MTTKKLLVLGVGNILLMDEGVGVYAVQELGKEDWPEHVDFVDGGTFTQDIFYLFEKYDHVLVLDAVRGGQEPGTIYRLKENDLIENKDQSLSLHDIDLLDSLNMAELLGKRPTLTVIGIEPEKFDWEMKLTPTLKKAFPEFLEVIRQEIYNILNSSTF